MRLVSSAANLAAKSLVSLALITAILPAQQYRFQTFGVERGLTNLEVRNIYQDRRGFLWASTQEGVFRFDGERFQSFGEDVGLPVSTAMAFGEAPDGSLLAGGSIGLYRLSGNRFEKIPIPGATSVSWMGGLRSDGHDKTYVATDAGLFVLTERSGSADLDVQPIANPPGITGSGARGIFLDKDTVWYGCGDQVCSLSGTALKVFGTRAGLNPTRWQVIGRDVDGDLWVRGRAVGLASLSQGASKFLPRDAPLPAAGLTGVAAVDRDGFLLFPAPEGLAIGRKNDWQQVGREQGLRGTVYCVLQDRQGAIWLGTAGRGLVRWAGYKQWDYYSSDTGFPSDLVYQVLPMPDGTIWAGTEAGLMRGQPSGESYRWQKISSVGSVPVHSIAADPDGTLWLGTEIRGVAHLHPGSLAVDWIGRRQGLDAVSPYGLRIDANHRLWAATESGLFVARLPFARFQPVSSLPSNRFWSIAAAKNGDIWAGGESGLYHLSGDSWQRLTTRDGLARDNVSAVGAGNEIWVGYLNGGEIDRISMADGKPHIQHIPRPRSEDAHLSYFLDFDSANRLWVGTERGVDVFGSGAWKHFDTDDGLAWDDCDLNGFAAGSGGSVWIGTSGGLSHYVPTSHPPPASPPSVVFTSISLGGHDVLPSDRPTVAARSNALVVQYSDLNFIHENALSFRYRLVPLFSDWRITNRRELEFPGLPPGAYRLELQLRDPWANGSAATAAFSFEIQTPWFRSYWFVGLCTLAALALGFLLLHLRFLVLRRREKELVSLVEQRTADLQRANEELYQLSATDGLTGVANRRAFDEALRREWARLPRSSESLSVLLLDVDHFKILNDTEGHQRGDQCLIQLAAEMRTMAKREIDLVARYGGEEFAFILPATGAADAMRLAEKLRVAIMQLRIGNPRSPVLSVLTVSIGVGTAQNYVIYGFDAFIAAIDRALYAAKRAGRNRVVQFEPPDPMADGHEIEPNMADPPPDPASRA